MELIPEHLKPKKPGKPLKPNLLEVSSVVFLLFATFMLPPIIVHKKFEKDDKDRVVRAFHVGCNIGNSGNPERVDCKLMTERFKEVYEIESRRR